MTTPRPPKVPIPAPHARFDDLLARCTKLAESWTGWRGKAFREAEIEYGKPDLQLNGGGAWDHGGRFNVPGTPAVYAALDPVTATAESVGNVREYGWPEAAVSKLTNLSYLRVTVSFILHHVLDLRDAGTRRRLGVTLTEMDEPWRLSRLRHKESLTQAIGRAAHQLGYEAVIFNSARSKQGMNLVYFPTNLQKGSKAEVPDADNLRRALK
jgi:RES domain-containing protein